MPQPSASEAFGHLVGRSGEMKAVFEVARKAAKVDLPTLIVGETGTGKELMAQELHRRSPRNAGPFVAVNTGAISTELVASELFGHKKGSFTSAHDDKRGRFDEANGGTLFLDEIGTMEDRIQIALLRVLENGAFRPIGAKKDVSVDVRLVAATNEDLEAAVESGAFREDLLFRLRVLSINLPPLREHPSDIPDLVNQFLDDMREAHGIDVERFDDTAMDALMRYPWPGNIRELRNLVAQAAVTAESGVIRLEHLPARISNPQAPPQSPAPAAAAAESSPPSAPPATTPTQPAPSEFEEDQPEDGMYVPLGMTLEDVQRLYALKTLESCDNNKTRAAAILGVSRKTLYDRLNRWGKS